MKKGTTYLLFLVALCWLHALPAWAQFSISGTVSDADGGTLPGAAIVIEDTYKGTFTDASGAFQLTSLKPGTLSLRVSLLGYEPQTRTVNLTQNATLAVRPDQNGGGR